MKKINFSDPRNAAVLTIALAIVVGIATLTPSQTMPSAPGSDKLHHFVAFAVLAFPMSYARPRIAIWVVMAATAYGGAIEVIQPSVGRYGDVSDAAANAAGAACGAVLGCAVHRLRAWKRGRQDPRRNNQ